MTTPNPLSNPELYESITLGGVRWPPVEDGKVDVGGATSPRNWDKVPSQGTDGMTVKYTGSGLAEFTIKFYLWEPEHFDVFESSIRPMTKKPPKGIKPKAYSIGYPELQKLQIDRCVITEVGQLEKDGDAGLFFYPIKFLEFRPKKTVQVLTAKANPYATFDRWAKVAASISTDPDDIQLEQSSAILAKARTENAAQE